jgi:hypothetical protein
VTRFKIDWDNAPAENGIENPTKLEMISDSNSMTDGITSHCHMNGDMLVSCESIDTLQTDNSQSNLNAMDLM